MSPESASVDATHSTPDAQEAQLHRLAARWLFVLRTLFIVLAVLLWLAFPEHDLWWLAPVAVALLGGVTLDVGARRGFGLGMLAGWAGIRHPREPHHPAKRGSHGRSDGATPCRRGCCR